MLYIVLPAYNEAASLPTLLETIEGVCADLPHVIAVVNDGSTDATSEVIENCAGTYPAIHQVKHRQNLGLGAALNSGFQYVLNYSSSLSYDRNGSAAPDMVITMDADNTQPPDHIPLLYQSICSGADLVIASRFVAGGEQHGLSLGRKMLSWGAGKVMSYFVPISGVRDYSCGYRAYRLSLLAEGTRQYGPDIIQSRNFSGMVELLLKIAPLADTVTEIPLKLHYELKKGASKMKVLATIWGYIQLIYHIKRQRWSPVEWVEE
ncbi:glycosyltransferase [Desulfosporosinus sp. PR]|uniref:glycosyltransferase n=1 Tax=Candidatus Desulfosporosinus nitrosoreducens TaxID=3401928 RepID=UPI0027FF5936|nr:glycosyltransferase [Desulfosporosinus sp. PR]MDQ7096789.1 glycosyltransferase [Desulfosporosinus sp. PR]